MFGQDRGSGVLVALHGHGDDPASARRWGRGMAPPGWEIVAPGAPTGSDGVRSWFSTGPRGVSPEELFAAVRRVADVVSRVRAAGRPVVVAGFSQGGAVALSLPQHGIAADAIVAVGSFLPEVDGGLGDGGALAASPVLVVTTRDDQDVPPFFGEDAAAHLRLLGVDAELAELEGGHEVGAGVQRHVSRWIAGALRQGPRVTLGLPTDRVDCGAELVSGAAVAELSVAFERLGFDALYVTDHPAPDDRWMAAGGHHSLDPAAVLSAAAAATTTIGLHTNVYVLPYRNPFLAAKQLASVDVLSGGRLILGVAAGYLRQEFDALGVPFEERAARLDEALELLPHIWAGETVAGESTLEGAGVWRARGATALPIPLQHPHPPIWVGGNSTAAMRRAIRFGQAWSPFPTPADTRGLRTVAIHDLSTLRERLSRCAELCEEAGRTEPLSICFSPFSGAGYRQEPSTGLAPMVEEIGQLAELGVHWVSLAVPGTTRAEVRERAAELSEALGLR